MVVYRANGFTVDVLENQGKQRLWGCHCTRVINHCVYMYPNNPYFTCIIVITVHEGNGQLCGKIMLNNSCIMFAIIYANAVPLYFPSYSMFPQSFPQIIWKSKFDF